MQVGDSLVRRNEAAEALQINACISMRDRFQGQVVYARQACGGTIQQTRKDLTVASWQVAPGGSNLLFDEIEIIEQPLSGWCNTPVRMGGCRQKMAGFIEDFFIGRQAFAVLLHLLFTEQL